MSNDPYTDIEWERLDRFVRGLGSPDERRAMEEWANAVPERRALIDAMRSIGREAGVSPPRFDAQRALRRFQSEIGGSVPVARPRPRVKEWQRPDRWHTVAALSAATAAAAVLVAVLSLSSNQAIVSVPNPEPPRREFTTAPGQRAAVELPDGSHVRLSAGSRLIVSGGFGGGRRREVSLVGEASFSVEHDSTRPFVVHTEYGVAEDLGTEFVINTYPEIHGMRLAVRDGRVGVRAGAPGDTTSSIDLTSGSALIAVLEKGDVATVSAKGSLSVVRGQDVSAAFSEVEGTLVLRSVTFRDAIPMLERWYGIRIRISEDGVLSRHVSGTFNEGSAVSAIETMATAVERKTHWKGNTVTFVSHIDSGGPQ